MTPRHSEPVRDPDLSAYVGLYVAILDGEVIASGATTVKLLATLRGMGEREKRAVIRRVPPPSDVIDLGWLSLPGAW